MALVNGKIRVNQGEFAAFLDAEPGLIWVADSDGTLRFVEGDGAQYSSPGEWPRYLMSTRERGDFYDGIAQLGQDYQAACDYINDLLDLAYVNNEVEVADAATDSDQP